MEEQPQVIEMPWGTVTIYENGNIVAETLSLITATNANGDINLTLKVPVNKITIANLLDVASHKIEQADGSTVHEISFLDGGYFRIGYRADGHLVALETNDMSMSVSPDGEIKVGAKTPTDLRITTPTSAATP